MAHRDFDLAPARTTTSTDLYIILIDGTLVRFAPLTSTPHGTGKEYLTA